MRSVRRLGLYGAVNIDLQKQPADSSACIDVPPVFSSTQTASIQAFCRSFPALAVPSLLCVFFKENCMIRFGKISHAGFMFDNGIHELTIVLLFMYFISCLANSQTIFLQSIIILFFINTVPPPPFFLNRLKVHYLKVKLI